jgi:hypothetical protein
MGSHAAGLDRVPFDGYIAQLHQNEAVLNADAADQWRQNARGAALSGANGGGTGGGAAVVIVNNYYSIGEVKADSPRRFIDQMPGQNVPSGVGTPQMKRDAARAIQEGRRHN